jgi:glycosyltransferase involved in cell wall biosynthesis
VPVTGLHGSPLPCQPTSEMPLFSIIVVHYQGVVSHAAFLRCIKSVRDQTFKDYELIVLHDGPLIDDAVDFGVAVECTDRRYNDWGHSLRDIGIRKATGDYILHLNADNLLYSDALEQIKAEIDRPPRLTDVTTGQPVDTADMILFPIILAGRQAFRGHLFRVPGAEFYVYLTGHPPKFGNIDCMQLVIKREIWLREGGWYDKSRNSDSFMYEKFCEKYGYRTVGPVLGEHH